MHFSRVSAIGAAGFLMGQYAHAAPSSSLWARAGVSDKLPAGINMGVCDPANMFNTPENRKINFVNANGWELVDEFLIKNGATDWMLNLCKTLFPQDSGSKCDCSTTKADCDIGRPCTDFQEPEVAAPGMWYVLESMKNLNTYLSQYQANLDSLEVQMISELEGVYMQFNTTDFKKESLDIGAIVGATLGFASAVTAPVAPASGAFGAASAFVGVVTSVTGKQEPVEIGKDTEYKLTQSVSAMIKNSREDVEKIRKAMFGLKDSNEQDIPQGMKWNNGGGAGKEWVHAITWVLGDGQWLLDRPAQDLTPKFAEMKLKLKQSVAFQLLRLLHGGFVIIDDHARDEKKCLEDKNSAWDGGASRCYTMYARDSNMKLLGGMNDPAHSLWESPDKGGFGMDRLATYKNTIDCWESNNANMNSADWNNLVDGLPKCFFGMEVKKGAFFEKDGTGYSGKQLLLDNNYMNFPNGEKFPVWPQIKCTVSVFSGNCQPPKLEDLK